MGRLDHSIPLGVRAPRLADLTDAYYEGQARTLQARDARKRGRLADLQIEDTITERANRAEDRTLAKEDRTTAQAAARTKRARETSEWEQKQENEILSAFAPRLRGIPDPFEREKLLEGEYARRGLKVHWKDGNGVTDQDLDGIEQGLLTPEKRADLKVTGDKKKLEEAQRATFEQWRKGLDPDLQAKKFDLGQADINRIAASFPATLSGYKPAEDFINNLKTKPVASPFAQANNDRAAMGQVIGLENSLRDEYNKKTQGFEAAATAYRKLAQALERNNPSDAYAAIINYVRTLDPQSTVREAEERLARERSTGTPLGRIAQQLSSWTSGTLTQDIQRNLLESGKGLAQAEYEGYKAHRADYEGRVRGYQARGVPIDPGAIIGSGDLGTEFEKLSGRDPFATAPKPHPQDAAAVQWAKQNPNDPRAQKILQANGAR